MSTAERKTVFVAYTNTDLTEGRGSQVPLAICALEATAIRLGRKRYVMGSDCPVSPMELVKIDGRWYAPSAAIDIVHPTKEDTASQALLDAKRAALEKARAAGLSEEEIKALGFVGPR